MITGRVDLATPTVESDDGPLDLPDLLEAITALAEPALRVVFTHTAPPTPTGLATATGPTSLPAQLAAATPAPIIAANGIVHH